MTRFGGFITSSVSFVFYVVSRFVKVIALIFIGAIVIMISTMTIASHFALPFLTIIAPHPIISGYIGFYAGLIAFLIIPLIMIIRYVSSYIWRYQRYSKFKFALAGVWIVSFIIFASTVGFTARNFMFNSEVTQTLSSTQINSGEPLDIQVDKLSIQLKNKLSFTPLSLYMSDGLFYCNDNIRLQFVPAQDDTLKITQTIFSRGMDRYSALRNARYTSHQISINDNRITLDDYCTLTDSDKYRSQRYQYDIAVPVGTQLRFNTNSSVFQDHLLRLQLDQNQSNWIMNQGGIELLDQG